MKEIIKKNNRYEVKASIIKEESVGKIRNIKKLTKKQEEMITPTTAQRINKSYESGHMDFATQVEKLCNRW